MTGTTVRQRALFALMFALGFCQHPRVHGATLTGTFTPIPQGAVINLTAEGALDWVHWGLITQSSVNRKTGVTPQIPDFKPIGFNGPYQYADNFNGYSWSDGAPTVAVTNTTTGVWMYGRSNGFQLNIPIGPSTNIVKLYVGTFGAVGRFDATLDGTALKYGDSSISNMSNGPGGVYTLTCEADTPGQKLMLQYLVERVFDPAGNVTLQAAALTAPGVNNPPVVSISSPPDNSSFAANSDLTISADASDADGTIAKVEFFQGATKLGESTSSPFFFTWANVPAGDYVLTAKATDNGGAATMSSPVEVFVNGSGGTLNGSITLPPADVDLTAEGTTDWAHWGLVSSNSFDHKSGVAQQISDFTKIGTNHAQQLTDYFTAFSWSDGTPTPDTNGTTTGVFTYGLTNGFLLTAPADTTSRTLKVYVGLYGAQGNFQAYLSDFGAPAYTDTSMDSVFGNVYAVYTLNYAAASPGQTLTIRYTARNLYDADYGNVTLQAATLAGGSVVSNSPPIVTLTSPTNNAAFTAPANVPFQADASDIDGMVSRVEFYSGATLLGTVTNTPYDFTWSGVPAGNYALTAKAIDNLGGVTTSTAVSITVTNSPATGVTILNPALNGNQFSLSFATVAGSAYAVEYTDSLNPILWQALTNFTGDGTTVSVTNVTTTLQRFYRVEAQ